MNQDRLRRMPMGHPNHLNAKAEGDNRLWGKPDNRKTVTTKTGETRTTG